MKRIFGLNFARTGGRGPIRLSDDSGRHDHYPPPHHPPPPPDPHLNSPGTEALVRLMDQGLAGSDEIRVKLVEWKSPLIGRFDELREQGCNDVGFLLGSLIREEQQLHLEARQKISEMGFHRKAAAVVPLPHHLNDILYSINTEMVFDSDELHHDKRTWYRHLDGLQPNELRAIWRPIEALVLEASWQEHGGALRVRECVLRALQIVQKADLQLFVHRLPHIPPHSRFVDLDAGYRVRFIS